MTRSKKTPHERREELRQILGAGPDERVTDAARRLAKSNGELRAQREHDREEIGRLKAELARFDGWSMCPHCLEPVSEDEVQEGKDGNLWHQKCVDGEREDDT